MGKLTAVAVKTALANPGTYQDGDGLFLKVDKRGGPIGFCAFSATANART